LAALEALGEALGPPERPPQRIECFDVSNIQGDRLARVDGGVGERTAEEVGLSHLSTSRP
jgi:hypothetical protein